MSLLHNRLDCVVSYVRVSVLESIYRTNVEIYNLIPSVLCRHTSSPVTDLSLTHMREDTCIISFCVY